MAKVFVFDFKHCNGCFNCQIACKDEHCEQAWLPYADKQPLTGQFWCKVDQTVRGQVPWVKVAYEAVLCGHCEDAPCLAAAGDAAYRTDDGFIIIDPAKSKGMKELVDSCPLGAIYFNEKLNIPQKCTGCAHLLENGWDEPRCVDACMTGGLCFYEESEVDLSAAEVAPALAGLGSKVYYLNRPKRFIAGTVVDFDADEVVIGAAVELKDAAGAVVASLATDDFGDFMFDQIDPGAYKVAVGGNELAADVTEKDLSLGDVAA